MSEWLHPSRPSGRLPPTRRITGGTNGAQTNGGNATETRPMEDFDLEILLFILLAMLGLAILFGDA